MTDRVNRERCKAATPPRIPETACSLARLSQVILPGLFPMLGRLSSEQAAEYTRPSADAKSSRSHIAFTRYGGTSLTPSRTINDRGLCRITSVMDAGGETQRVSASDIQRELTRRLSSTRSSPCSSPRSLSPKIESTWYAPDLSTPPQTVLLCLWPRATDDQIHYYARGYESLYPSAKVCLLRYSSSYDEQLRYTLDALTTSEEKHSDQSILLHLFGDDSAAQACRLLRTYRIRTGHTIGIEAVIMDSVPRLHIPTLRSAFRLSREIPTLLAALFVFAYYRLLWLIFFWQTEDRICQNRHDLNDPTLIPADATKCYIFTSSDLMFSWTDKFSRDDGELVRQDYAIRRSSIDEKGRWTGDQERYWLGIESAWNAR
nr:hypothetical protein CFP56_19445 [Quercus suber]